MGTHGGARPFRETRADCSAVPARVCRPGRGHNGAAARYGTGVPGEVDTPDKDAGRQERRTGGRFAAARRHHGGWGELRPGARPRFPSARVPESSRILPGARLSSIPESAQNPLGARPRSSLEPARDAPQSPPGIPLELVPVPVRPARHRTSPSRVGFGYARLYRLGGAPIGGDARDPAPGPALRSALGRRPRAPLSSRPPSPRLGPGLALVRPLAPRAWIDLVALASGSRNRPASTARLPIPGAQPARRSPSLTRAPRAPAAA